MLTSRHLEDKHEVSGLQTVNLEAVLGAFMLQGHPIEDPQVQPHGMKKVKELHAKDSQ